MQPVDYVEIPSYGCFWQRRWLSVTLNLHAYTQALNTEIDVDWQFSSRDKMNS